MQQEFWNTQSLQYIRSLRICSLSWHEWNQVLFVGRRFLSFSSNFLSIFFFLIFFFQFLFMSHILSTVIFQKDHLIGWNRRGKEEGIYLEQGHSWASKNQYGKQYYYKCGCHKDMANFTPKLQMQSQSKGNSTSKSWGHKESHQSWDLMSTVSTEKHHFLEYPPLNHMMNIIFLVILCSLKWLTR